MTSLAWEYQVGVKSERPEREIEGGRKEGRKEILEAMESAVLDSLGHYS